MSLADTNTLRGLELVWPPHVWATLQHCLLGRRRTLMPLAETGKLQYQIRVEEGSNRRVDWLRYRDGEDGKWKMAPSQVISLTPPPVPGPSEGSSARGPVSSPAPTTQDKGKQRASSPPRESSPGLAHASPARASASSSMIWAEGYMTVNAHNGQLAIIWTDPSVSEAIC